MSLWELIFTFPFEDGWLDVEDSLASHIADYDGEYEAGGPTMGRRETFGTFKSKAAAEACGQAAHSLHIKFLSWEIEEVQVTK